MIFQNGYDWGQFVADIIGAVIATIGAILIWYIIEGIKKWKESKKIQDGFQQFYDIISNFDVSNIQKAELDKAKLMHLIEYEIVNKHISKVLKLRYRQEYSDSAKFVHVLESYLWRITIQSGMKVRAFNIRRYDGVEYHFDGRPGQDINMRNSFVNYIKEECKKEKINLE